nr:MAG TPA: hypothetical protein [Caudoviricetes sp.]
MRPRQLYRIRESTRAEQEDQVTGIKMELMTAKNR